MFPCFTNVYKKIWKEDFFLSRKLATIEQAEARQVKASEGILPFKAVDPVLTIHKENFERNIGL